MVPVHSTPENVSMSAWLAQFLEVLLSQWWKCVHYCTQSHCVLEDFTTALSISQAFSTLEFGTHIDSGKLRLQNIPAITAVLLHTFPKSMQIDNFHNNVDHLHWAFTTKRKVYDHIYCRQSVQNYSYAMTKNSMTSTMSAVIYSRWCQLRH